MASGQEPSAKRRTSSDVLFGDLLPAMIEKRLNEWIQNSSSVRIFITGKTGTGKSTLINSLVGSKVSPEGDTLKPMTDKVEEYSKVIGGIEVKVWDSPGLQDGTDNEKKYLEEIKRNCKGKVDLLLYCIDMSSTRFVPGNKDIQAMKKLTDKLGVDIWKNTLIVLTCANLYIMSVEDEYKDDAEGLQAEYAEEVESWKGLISDALKDEVGLNPQIIKSIPIVPAGHYIKPRILPGDGFWLSAVWEKAASATHPLAQPAFVILNERRLNDPSSEICSIAHQRPHVLEKIGFLIGKSLGVDEIGRTKGLSKVQEILLELAVDNEYVDISTLYTSESNGAEITVDINQISLSNCVKDTK